MCGVDIYEALRSIEGIQIIDNSQKQLTCQRGDSVKLVALHSAADSSQLSIKVEEGATLNLVEIFVGEAFRSIDIEQAENSTTHLTLLELSSSNVEISSSLMGRGSESQISGLFLAGDKEHCEVRLTTRHMVPDCRSNSLIKGVASGISEGRFEGLVYVAKDAQRTDARQTSRNIELNDGAKIKTLPQLEIYADDVKCSHGATVGQLDKEAILYMRQRGLSEAQARRLQIEGFAADIVLHEKCDQLRDILCSAIERKLQTM